MNGSTDSAFPQWVKMLAALGPALAASVTLLVGIMVAVIAYRQWRTAHEKLLIDLFDRRFSVYASIKEIIAEFQRDPLKAKVLIETSEAFAKSRFLFGKDVYTKLFEIRDDMLRWSEVRLEDRLDDNEKQNRFRDDRNASLRSKVRAFEKDMPSIFSRYIKLDQAGFL